MVNTANHNKINLMSKLTGLNEPQAQACDEALNKTQFIAYHKLYALNHAQGLTTQQWQKAYQFKKEYDFLKDLCSEPELHTLLSSQDKFFPFDVLMKSLAQHPNILSSFDEKTLLSDAKKIISQPTLTLEINEETQKAMQYALAIDLFNNAKLLHQIRKKFLENGQFHLHVINKNNEQTKSLISEWPTKLLIKKIDSSLFLKFWQAKKNNYVDADFKLENQDDSILQILADHLGWKPQNNPADSWIHEALTLAIEVYFYPRIKRDILAKCYDYAVEQLLPIVETQWRQLLLQQGIGEQYVLMFFPHGKSGVMIFLMDPQGEVLENFTIYPHAPDYDIEQSIVQIAKILTRHPVTHMGWLVQIETKKAIQKLLHLTAQRYPDIQCKVHFISPRLCPMFTRTEKKAPQLEEIAQAGYFLQNPWPFWTSCQPAIFLQPILRHLPKEKLHQLWRCLLQENLLLEGIDIKDGKPCQFQLIDNIQPQEIDKLIQAKEQEKITSHQQIHTIMNISAERYSYIAPFLKVGNNFESYPFLDEDKKLIDAILLYTQCSLKELMCDNTKIAHALQSEELIQAWGYDRLFRVQTIVWMYQERHKPVQQFTSEHKKKIHEIPTGARFLGTVTKIMSYGCFIDLGEKTEGLIHISAIGDCFINDLNLILSPGESVIVEWIYYDEKQKRLSLRLQSEKLKKKLIPHQSEKKLIPKKPQLPKSNKTTPHVTAIGPSAMELAFAKLKK